MTQKGTDAMTVKFCCADVGVACRHVTKAENADDLVAKVAEHARKAHGVELNDTLIDYATTKVRSS